MMRWLVLRYLTRRRARLAARIFEVKDYVYSGMAELGRLEARLAAVDAELLLAESPRVLLSRSRADSGLSPRG